MNQAIATTFDLIIRNGEIYDGRGGDPLVADIGVVGDRIAAIGRIEGSAPTEIDARGCIVTPGFVDAHTHYDGQAIWSSQMAPSSSHGVTTVVMGNCGVGFAPCKPQDHDMLVSAMEGVEDIPEAVITAGLTWNWETFPEFLKAVDAHPHDIDIAAYVPHSPLRVFVMGERGANREPATTDDLVRMTSLAREALAAGAIGFSTSDHSIHRRSDGVPIPTLNASETELAAIATALGEVGGTFQMLATLNEGAERAFQAIEMMGRLANHNDITVTFTLAQTSNDPELWRDILARVTAINDGPGALKPQLFPRPIGMVLGHNLSNNPFLMCPSYQALQPLAFADKIAELRKPEVRARILGETPEEALLPIYRLGRAFDDMYLMTDPPNYEPHPDDSVTARAAREGVSPDEIAYDLLMENQGEAMLYVALANYCEGNLDFVYDAAQHPDVILALGDGGAHYGLICDASYTTFVLTHWTRDRAGSRISLSEAVQALSAKPAAMMGLNDRGLIAPGYKADINVIDYARLRVHKPEVRFDLPGGGRRLHQSATGYRATIVSGEVIVRDDVATGALPGRLVRRPMGTSSSGVVASSSLEATSEVRVQQAT